MEARHRIARAEFAALDPVDHGKKAHAKTAHPLVDVRRAAPHISLCPRLGPAVLGAEFGKAPPVAQGQIAAIADALAALLGRADEEHPAKALPRKTSEGAFLVAVEQQHRLASVLAGVLAAVLSVVLAAVEQIQRGGDARDPPADDQDIVTIRLHVSLHGLLAMHGCRIGSHPASITVLGGCGLGGRSIRVSAPPYIFAREAMARVSTPRRLLLRKVNTGLSGQPPRRTNVNPRLFLNSPGCRASPPRHRPEMPTI